MNYYNDFDPNACAWLEGLIEAKEIPPGKVDNRSITDVTPTDLSGYTQCHFFAGVGGWPLALRLAGVPSTRRLWSASCPCPPFSSAGKKKLCPECGGKPIPHPLKTGIFACIPCGHEWFADARHLYPELHRLIVDRHPPVVFGEQVVGTDGLVWLSGVRATLEAASYGVGASDLCSAGQASPNVRQRIYWVADAEHQQSQGSVSGYGSDSKAEGCRTSAEPTGHCATDGMGHASPSGLPLPKCADLSTTGRGQERRATPQPSEAFNFRVADADGMHARSEREQRSREQRQQPENPRANFWADSNAIQCSDGKHRRIPTEPALFPLADGLPYKLARRGSIRPALLKGAGNAINPYVASQFIRAYYGTKSNHQ